MLEFARRPRNIKKTAMCTFTLRPATIDELEFVGNCARSSYQQYVRDIGREPAPMVADFGRHLKRNELFVVCLDDQLCGYIVWWLTDDALHIDNVAILPSHRGKGICRKCFDLLTTKAQDAGKSALKLYTNEKMYGNLQMYPKLGFTETHRKSEHGFQRVYFRKSV